MDGVFKTGQEADGYRVVNISKAGFQSQQYTVLFQRGEVVRLNVPLYPDGNLSVSGQVSRADDLSPVPNASVSFLGKSGQYKTTTDNYGNFSFNLPPGMYTIGASAPGVGKTLLYKQKVFANQFFNLKLSGIGHQFGNPGPEEPVDITAGPNPYSDNVELIFPPGKSADRKEVFTADGKLVEQLRQPVGDAPVLLGQNWVAGTYFIRVQEEEGNVRTVRVVKR